MSRLLRVLPLLVLAVLPTGLFGQGFKPYPGAKLDEKATQAAQQEAAKSGMTKKMQPVIYVTPDAFEKVVAYYRGMAKEYTMPGREAKGPTKLPTGQELKRVYFIFDAATDLATSKLWAIVQRPYVGAIKFEGGTVRYEDVRDVTSIALSETK